MAKTKFIKKTLPIILSLSLSLINSKNIETKQALLKNKQQTIQLKNHIENNYNKDWAGNIRIVNVSVGADEEFIEKYGDSWKSRIDNYIQNASENYYKNFGIEFKISEYIEWKSDDFSDYSSLLYDIKKIGINGDTLIAYTNQTDYIYLGMAEHNRAIVEDTWPKCTIYVTMHEFGHLFDLKHAPESWSIMNKFANLCYPTFADWDEKSKQNILNKKYKIFE